MEVDFVKMFFATGKFDDEKGYRLDFSPNCSTETDGLIREAVYNVDIMLIRGEIEHILKYGKDIFAIFDPKKITKEDVLENVNKLIKGNMGNVINSEDVFLDAAVQNINFGETTGRNFYCEDTVFWDLFNQIIIVLGRDNLEKMGKYLEYLTLEKYNVINDEQAAGILEREDKSFLVKKINNK